MSRPYVNHSYYLKKKKELCSPTAPSAKMPLKVIRLPQRGNSVVSALSFVEVGLQKNKVDADIMRHVRHLCFP